MRPTPLKNRRNQAGFSLVELAVVLGVVGLILGGIWVAASTVYNANKANQAAADITQIAANIRSTYLAANSFPAAWVGKDETTTLNTAGIFPSDLLSAAGAAPTDSWSGTVNVLIGPAVTSPPNYDASARVFRISFNSTTADACFRIASQITSLGTNDAAFDMVANCNAPIAATAATETAISTACQTAGACQAIGFDYKIH